MPSEHVDVDDRAFLASFPAALEEIKAAAIEDTEKVAAKVVEIAVPLAPERTGALKADIHAEPFVPAGRGGYVKIIARVREAFYQEFGTSKMRARPFMRPALAQVAGGLRSVGVAARLASGPAARAAFKRARQRQRVHQATLRHRRKSTAETASQLVTEKLRLGELEKEAHQARRQRRQ